MGLGMQGDWVKKKEPGDGLRGERRRLKKRCTAPYRVFPTHQAKQLLVLVVIGQRDAPPPVPPSQFFAVLLQVVHVEVIHVFGPLASVGQLIQRTQRRVAQQRAPVAPRADVEGDAMPHLVQVKAKHQPVVQRIVRDDVRAREEPNVVLVLIGPRPGRRAAS